MSTIERLNADLTKLFTKDDVKYEEACSTILLSLYPQLASLKDLFNKKTSKDEVFLTVLKSLVPEKTFTALTEDEVLEISPSETKKEESGVACGGTCKWKFGPKSKKVGQLCGAKCDGNYCPTHAEYMKKYPNAKAPK
jgi:hypothetical protein